MTEQECRAFFFQQTDMIASKNHEVYRGFKLGMKAEREKYEALFAEIKEWSKAYPETVFPTPDWEKVRDALEMNGLTLDSVSAANMRHVIKHIQEMVDETIRARGQT
jgi:hypothetical protein